MRLFNHQRLNQEVSSQGWILAVLLVIVLVLLLIFQNWFIVHLAYKLLLVAVALTARQWVLTVTSTWVQLVLSFVGLALVVTALLTGQGISDIDPRAFTWYTLAIVGAFMLSLAIEALKSYLKRNLKRDEQSFEES